MSIYSSELLSALVYGGDNNDNFNSFYKYGNYIYAVGSTYSEGFGSQDILIVKFNKNDLSIVEKKVYGESGHENLEDLYVEEDYIYAIGSSDVLGQGKKDALLMKLDKDNLNIVDLKVYGGSQNDSFTAIQVDEEYIYVVGQTESVGAGESDTLLVIFDKENLDIINEEIYGGISVDYFNSIYVTDNCIYAGGATQSLGIVNGEVLDEEEYTPEELLVMGIGNKDLLLVKFNKDLEIIERKVLGNAADNFVQAIYGDEEYIYVAGQTKNITREQSDALIGKFDVTDLDDYELKAYGLNSSEDIFQDIYIDQDYIYASGSASSSGTRNLDASIIRLSKTDFNTKKVKIFGSSKNDVFNKIYSDGDYIYTCGQTKIGDFYDSILTKVISLEDGINNTSPENFVWEDSNLDFFDIHLLSTDSDGLELNMASISSSTEEYIVLGSDNFLFEILEEEELTYTVEVVTSTIEYNTFDITIEPPLEELVKNNFKFFKGEEDAQIEILVIFSNFEGSTEELSTYNIGVYLEDNENLEFEEDINYEVQVIEWIEEDEEEEEIIDESLILVSPVLTSGYQDSALTDSYLNIGKYIVSSNNENFCANYACCSDADCNDNNSNTSDACINPYFDNAYCQHELIPSAIECLSSIDCEDGISCTTDICVLGTNACSHQDILENIDDDGCCLSSVWTYEFVPWKLDNDCDRALQINSPLIIGDAEEILNLFSDNPQAIILLQEFIYDENDAINHGTKVLIGKLEADNIYTSYNDYSGEGILILEVINSGSSLEEQILSIDISGVLKNIYLPSIDSSISAEVDYYIADDGATYYSLYKGNGFFMSPLEAFIDQNLAQDSI